MPDPVEPSEEVRLLLVRLLRALVAAAEAGIAPYAADVAQLFTACARDAAPSVLVVQTPTRLQMRTLRIVTLRFGTARQKMVLER